MFWLSVLALAVLVAAFLYQHLTIRLGEGGRAGRVRPPMPEDLREWLLFDQAPIGYQEIDSEGTIVRVNRRECTIRRRAEDELIGLPCWELAPIEDREKMREEILRKLAGEGTMLPLRRRYVRPGGDTITLEVHETLLDLPDGLQGMLIASQDITERQKNQEEVFRTTNELKALFQALPDLLLRLDANGRVLDSRASQPEESFAHPETLIGQRFAETMAPEEGLKVLQAMARVRKTHSTAMTEFSIEENGETQIYEARFCPIYREELIAVIRRVTERRVAEERLEHYAQELEHKNEELAGALANAREATEMKSRFLANMSHEIRTPMNGVLGMTDFLLGTPLNAEQREYATAVKNSADALLVLINDILDISKIEAGKLRLERIPFDLAVTVEEIAAMCALRARAKGLAFTCASTDDLPAYVVGDPGRLRQVLNNLIGNAIKFTTQGKVSVFTELIRDYQQTASLRFLVQDTGIGIDAEHGGKLFQSFVQGDNSTTRKYGGTGLGLAISKQLVEMMGGEIGFHSEPGRGSTFHFTVVFEKAPAIIPFEAEDGPAVRASRQLDGVPVVLLAPQHAALAPMRQCLDSWGLLCTFLEDPAELSTTLHKAVQRGVPYRLVLADLDLPNWNGAALAAALKQDLQVRDTILIGMISQTSRSDAHALREAGFAACLHKPLRAALLLDALESALRPKEKTASLAALAATVTVLAQPGARPGGAMGQPRILLAEDNLINQRIALRLLQRLGLHADVANNGSEAVDAAARQAYDLILMDCQMPEMDGFEATAEIRRREEGSRRVAICALTANAMVGDRERCLAAGMDDYISKPVSLADLKGALGRLLHKEVTEASAKAAEAISAAS